LNNVLQAAAQDLYNAQAQQGGQPNPDMNTGSQPGNDNKGAGDFTDVDFEEVK
jgi:molecular chaperone DnaK